MPHRRRTTPSPAHSLATLTAAVALAGLALGCASTSPAGPAKRVTGERYRVTGSYIPRKEPIPEHGLAQTPFQAEAITRDEIRQSGAMTAIEALQRQ